MTGPKYLLVATVALLIGFAFGASSAEAQMYRFSGGPSGGTFQYYASAISTLARKNGIKVLASSSGGAIENIRTVNSGKSSFAITYSGNVYLARQGQLKQDERKYENVLAVASLYAAPAQLVVKEKSDIDSPAKLVGKRVAIGNAGSGAAANAEIFFTSLGIWDDIKRENLGYRAAADAFKNGQVDAFWVFVGYPNAAVIEASLQNNVRLLDIWTAANDSGLFKQHPYFTAATIPAKTYRGQKTEVATFQDAALWVASKDVSADLVYDLLKIVFDDEGLAHMAAVHKSAKAMNVETGLDGILTPLHPGAEKFWKEKGLIE